jgi:mono/diheme cytochrome c family protein
MRRGVAAALAAAVAVAGFAIWVARPEWQEEPVVETQIVLTPGLVAKGEYLARAGNCIGCHTAPGQPAYAGGRAIATPFGDVYSSNLTPDEATGIGKWTSADFWRAMHYGKSRDGRRLFPAFPFTNYTRVTREDSDAIFAFLKSLEPVESPRIEPKVRFPFNTQLAMLVWRALYFMPGELPHDPARSPEWNRGAYLVEGLGHCDACHTARTALGGTDESASYGGGRIPMLGWDALPLALEQPMSDEDARDMAEVLKSGTSRRNVATGPMAEVVYYSLQYLSDEDIDAIVTYIRSLPPSSRPRQPLEWPVGPQRAEELFKRGQVVYVERCAECHGDQGEGVPYKYPALAGNRLVAAPSPNNALHTLMLGGFGPSTRDNPRPHGMPPYAHQLSFEEIAAVLTYVRASWGNAAPAVSPIAVERR